MGESTWLHNQTKLRVVKEPWPEVLPSLDVHGLSKSCEDTKAVERQRKRATFNAQRRACADNSVIPLAKKREGKTTPE